MAKKSESDVAESVADEAQNQMLEAFCAGLSATDKRVELISAFYRQAKSKGLLKASQAKFMAAWEEFGNLPA